ncbi:MAG TPA: hypothetical protein VIJ25_05350 [Methylococcales bacterium]
MALKTDVAGLLYVIFYRPTAIDFRTFFEDFEDYGKTTELTN